MNSIIYIFNRIGKFVWVAIFMGGLLSGCGGRAPSYPANFVGKWKSGKLETPLFLHENGEWEIKNEAGGVLQYGIWEYRDGRIIWRYKNGAHIGSDVNVVLFSSDKEFRLQEGAQVTVFEKLD